jgi:hypothetical protein
LSDSSALFKSPWSQKLRRLSFLAANTDEQNAKGLSLAARVA